ncbi:MAG: D-alanyl-D-alanine carboxypeptidase [Clostridia bacterium]|nr:D-alanyl-D-alanine carboxypeptidase [Clostridia bacterium]
MGEMISSFVIKILIIVAALAVAVCVAVGVILGVKHSKENDTGDGGAVQTGGDVDDDGLGGSPLYKTNATRSSYIGTSDSSTKLIEGIKSNNAILVELDGYTVVASKGADEKIYPASMTKVMTLLVACEMVTDLEEVLEVKEEHINFLVQSGGSADVTFTAGDWVRVEDLLNLIIYDSDTIACLLLAERYGGSEAGFVELMNNKAEEMGLTSTNFKNTTGLHDAEHYTTCREMAAIMAYSFENELAKKILTAYEGYRFKTYEADGKTVRDTHLSWSDWYSNKERFYNNPVISGSNPKVTVIAGKTGKEEIPRNCFVTYATDANGVGYVAVTVGRSNESQPGVLAAESTADMKYIYRNYVK